MPQVVQSATLVGVHAHWVRVEVDVRGGLPSFSTVGLAEAAVRESRARVFGALHNAGLGFPSGRVTVNLAPGDLRKYGTALDLPIALGVHAADKELELPALKTTMIVGELSLGGEVRAVPGVLAAAECAKESGLSSILVSRENAREAALVSGIDVYGVSTLGEAHSFLRSPTSFTPMPLTALSPARRDCDLDLAEVRGQDFAKRALEIAAAGGHNLLFFGGPGCGKTMLAERLPSILPPLTRSQALEVARIHSVVGARRLNTAPPFRAPHHTTTPAGLIGGGRILRPGEVCLAHRGVLFLDELPEFSRATLEVMRQPLESGGIVLSRAAHSVSFPARFQLVAAMNRCPCGLRLSCACTPRERARYQRRISAPLLDRIDLHVEVPLVDAHGAPGEPSKAIRARVMAARERGYARSQVFGEGMTNAALRRSQLDEVGRFAHDVDAVLARAATKLSLSARAVFRCKRVARTIADLAGSDDVSVGHVREALAFRASP